MKSFNKMIGMGMMALAMVSFIPSAYAQDNDNAEMRRVRKERNEAKRSIYKRSPRMARQQAKKWEREGWKSMTLPIDKQLEVTWERMTLVDATTGYPKYIHTESQANAQSFSAAQMQAENIARINIASDIAGSVASLTDVAIANREISPSESITVQEAVQNSKVLVAEKLGRVFTSLCVYKQTKNQYTVRVIVLYDMAQAAEIAKQTIKEQLEDKLKDNGKMLDNMIGLDKFSDTYMDKFDEEL